MGTDCSELPGRRRSIAICHAAVAETRRWQPKQEGEKTKKVSFVFPELLNFPSRLKAASAALFGGYFSGPSSSVLPGVTPQQEGSGLDVSPSP